MEVDVQSNKETKLNTDCPGPTKNMKKKHKLENSCLVVFSIMVPNIQDEAICILNVKIQIC